MCFIQPSISYDVLCILQNDLCFQGKLFNIKLIQVYALTNNAEEAETEQSYEDLQDLLELTPPKKNALFIIVDWNAKVGFKIAGRNVNNFRYADDTTLAAESEEKLKSLVMKVNEESEKVVLKLNIQKTKIIASGLITSWQIDGETLADFILGAPKSVDGDCNHEIKRHSLESYDQPRPYIKKQRHYFANKGPSNQGYSLSSSHVWM